MMLTKLEKHEKRWRERNWRHFSYTRKGRMSWSNAFCDRIRRKNKP